MDLPKNQKIQKTVDGIIPTATKNRNLIMQLRSQSSIHNSPTPYIEATAVMPTAPVQASEIDSKKRMFLKVMGVTGLGVLGSLLLPKKTSAFLFGSAPGGKSSSGPVSIKNASNVTINPATEDTLQLVKTDTDSINTNVTSILANTTAIQSSTAAIQTSTGNIPAKGQAMMTASLPVVIAADQSPLPISGSMTFDATSKMTVDAADSLFYLRKIVKQLESVTTVDAANRQRVYIDGSASLTVTLASTAVTTIAGQGDQMFQDVARNTYANGIRNNLAFT